MRRVVVVGDALLDRDLDGVVERLCPDAPVPVLSDPVPQSRPGGAGLAAVLAAGDGLEVVLVTAIAADGPGRELAALLRDGGVEVVDLGLAGPTPEKVRVRAGGRSLLRIDHGGAGGDVGPMTDGAQVALKGAATVLVADYGRGMTASLSVRAALEALPGRTPVVWDPHPRGALPVAGVRLATPNQDEAARELPDLQVTGMGNLAAQAARARALAERWRAAAVAITLGSQGALVAGVEGTPLLVPAPVVTGGDACGAGDRFASAAAAALAGGAVVSEAIEAAVCSASAYVAAGGASAALPRGDSSFAGGSTDPFEVVARVRATGGTVVATGGCFDILHAGHVGMLQAARLLGDCLVVCLNADASVRRLKGQDRPLQSAADRTAVLLALDCVDAVAVFEEETPVAVLERLRPDVFAKGGDYAVADLPEAGALARWGGQVVVLPYLPGRSTTKLLAEAARRG